MPSCLVSFYIKYENFIIEYEHSRKYTIGVHIKSYYPNPRFNPRFNQKILGKYDKLYTYITDDEKPIKDDEKPIKDDEKPIYDYKELLRLVKPKMVVSVKKKDRFPPQKKLPPPIKFSYKGGW